VAYLDRCTHDLNPENSPWFDVSLPLLFFLLFEIASRHEEASSHSILVSGLRSNVSSSIIAPAFSLDVSE
jgi:hypothetical protein